MENPRKIDTSFKERQGVLHLLEKLKKETITYAEMDEIGSLIRKAGRAAVQPLLRNISREKSGSLISKYTYLLDFLDDRYWLDQIIHIALKRRDLEVEGKSAILATLEDCGIDVTLPPFSRLLSSSSLAAGELFTRLVERGEEGLVSLHPRAEGGHVPVAEDQRHHAVTVDVHGLAAPGLELKMLRRRHGVEVGQAGAQAVLLMA